MKIWDNQHYYYYIITITLSFILFLFSALMLIKHVQYENKYYTKTFDARDYLKKHVDFVHNG